MTTATPTAEPLLDISGLAPERPTVLIRTEAHKDGVSYELRLLNELGIIEQQRLIRNGRSYDELFNKDNLTGPEGKRLKAILDAMFEAVLLRPASMSDKEFSKAKAEMNDHVRQQVVTAFTVAPLALAERTAQEEESEAEEPSPSTTES